MNEISKFIKFEFRFKFPFSDVFYNYKIHEFSFTA